MARPQSTQTRKILELHAEGLSVNDIAAKLKLSYTGVYSALARNGIKVRKGVTATSSSSAADPIKKSTKTTKAKTSEAGKKTKKAKKPKKAKKAKRKPSKRVRKAAKKPTVLQFTTLETTTEPASITSSTGALNISSEAPNPLVSIYTPLTAAGLSRKLADQLSYLNARVVEVKKIMAAIKNA